MVRIDTDVTRQLVSRNKMYELIHCIWYIALHLIPVYELAHWYMILDPAPSVRPSQR